MGLDPEVLRFVLQSYRGGVSFRRMATLGRQSYFVSRKETARLFKEFEISEWSWGKLGTDPYERSRYADDLWPVIGADQVATIDASPFEGASHIHDLNDVIPSQWVQGFDAVLDIGTLEHVFNFPVAIRNCMHMVKIGGHLLIVTPANNYMGHGFYQFSPELFYRVLTPENGFTMERMIAVEQGPRHRWFNVNDPKITRAQMTLVNSFPVLLFILAKRFADRPITNSPQQSAYDANWGGIAAPGQRGEIDQFSSSKLDKPKRWLLENFPRLARFMEAFRSCSLNRTRSFRNRNSFVRSLPPPTTHATIQP